MWYLQMKLSYTENDIKTADLYLASRQIAKISSLTPSIISITDQFTLERFRVENFIRNIYKNCYGASITVNYPVLMSVRDENGTILSALGFRYAINNSLFLENYTPLSIERYLDCSRKDIVDVGNLASAGQGASVFLFAALASYLYYKEVKFAAITGTDFLHKYFKNLGLCPRKICDADINAITQEDQCWGSYYDTRPRVLIGSVVHGVKKLNDALGAEFQLSKTSLRSRLHYRGNYA